MASGGAAPVMPSSTTPAVTGTTSATVIQSMPSMKLTRLTNQTPPSSSSARSSGQGSCGTTRNSAGSAAITIPTARICMSRRGAGPSPRMSSIAPTSASSTAASAEREQLRSPARPGDDADAEPGARQRRGDDRDAAALRRRLAVRGAGIRARHRIAREIGPERENQSRAQRRRDDEHEAEHAPESGLRRPPTQPPSPPRDF